MEGKTITLREARQAKGWTIQQLADASGIGWALIQAIETGRTSGNLITRHRLSDALGVPFRLMWPDSMEEWGELFAMMKKRDAEGAAFKDAKKLKRLQRAVPQEREA